MWRATAAGATNSPARSRRIGTAATPWYASTRGGRRGMFPQSVAYGGPVHRVSAVILAYYRRDTVAEVLGLLDDLDPIDEVIVVDNGDDGTDELVRSWGGKVRLVEPGGNT